MFSQEPSNQWNVDEAAHEVNLPHLMRKRMHMRKMTLKLNDRPQEAVNHILLLDLIWV